MLSTDPEDQIHMLRRAAILLNDREACLKERGYLPATTMDAFKILVGLPPQGSILRADILQRSLVLDCLNRMKEALPDYVEAGERFTDNFSLWLLDHSSEDQADLMAFTAKRLENAINYNKSNLTYVSHG